MAQYVYTMIRVGKIVPPKREILKNISLSFFPGAKIGVLGLNGSGKSTLLRIMAGLDKDIEGEAVPMPGLSIGFLPQGDDIAVDASVRDFIVGGAPDHVWAANARTRATVEHLLAEVVLDAQVGHLSGGERRRVALLSLLLADHDLLILDEPTNHLDVEAVDWLARHLNDRQAAKVAMVSALGQESLVTEALAAGAVDYIVKPFKPDSVIATLRKIAEKAP